MTVKTITIKESAYEVLKSWKRPGDSFSDVIERIGPKKVTAKDLFGKWKLDPKRAKEIRKELLENRKRWDKEWEERRNALVRHLSSD